MCAEIYEEGNNTQYKLYGSDWQRLKLPSHAVLIPLCQAVHICGGTSLFWRFAMHFAMLMKTKCVLPAVAGAWLARAEISPISCPRALCLF